ncbi:MAG: ABC transporter ATP-binding protein, partial [Pseudomonadota bacterium]
MLFRFFENAVDPLKDEAPERPPRPLWSFIWFYTKPFRWLFLSTIVTSILIAFIEVFAFERIGNLIDLAAGVDAATFMSDHGRELVVVILMIGLLWPVLTVFDELPLLQGINGNMPMSIRWRAHRYLLRQSTSFFADDFAGRVATKVMQTALSAREVVTKLANLCVWGGVYFASALFLFFVNDWRLTIPLLFWLASYIAAMRFFLPKLAAIAEQTSEHRSMLTGRIVDAYTNINTVKLFSTGPAEDAYAGDGMKTMLGAVHHQMRLATTLAIALHTMNCFLIAGTLGLGVYLWTAGSISVGAVAFA